MGLIDKFLGRKNRNKDIKDEDIIDPNNPVLTLVFEDLPIIKESTITENIDKIERLKKRPQVFLEKELNNGEVLLSVVEFDEHRVKLVGFDAPLPEDVIHHTVECSYWKDEDKEKIKKHKSHIICYYDGESDDAVEKYIALYKVAYSFMGQGLIGIINEGAWTCQPAYVLGDLLSKEMLMECREVPPLMLWTSFIKIPVEYGIWMVTKGNHIFGVKDFAYLGDINEVKEINEIFNNIFYYIYENSAVVEAGHTLQIEEEVYLKFKNIYKEKEYLEGPIGTLVIEKIKANEIN